MTSSALQALLDAGPSIVTIPPDGVVLDSPLIVRRNGVTIQGSGGRITPPPASAAFVVRPGNVSATNPASHRVYGPEGRWAYRTRGEACLLFLGTAGDCGPQRADTDNRRNWEGIRRFQLDLRATRNVPQWDTGTAYMLSGLRGPTVGNDGYDHAAPWYLFHSPGEGLSFRYRTADGVQRAIYLPTPNDETLTVCVRLDFYDGSWTADVNGVPASGTLIGGGFWTDTTGTALIVGNPNVNGGPETGPDITYSGLAVHSDFCPPSQWFAPNSSSVFHLSHPWGLETVDSEFCGWQGKNGVWGWGLLVCPAEGTEFRGVKFRDLVIERGGDDRYGCGIQLWPGWDLSIRDTEIVGGAYGFVCTAGLSSNSYPWRLDNVAMQDCTQSGLDMWNVAALRVQGLSAKHCGPFPVRFRRCCVSGGDWFVTEGGVNGPWCDAVRFDSPVVVRLESVMVNSEWARPRSSIICVDGHSHDARESVVRIGALATDERTDPLTGNVTPVVRCGQPNPFGGRVFLSDPTIYSQGREVTLNTTASPQWVVAINR